jgi:hypothetical protein
LAFRHAPCALADMTDRGVTDFEQLRLFAP